jgi:mono/diheme cytochrome c family protein
MDSNAQIHTSMPRSAGGDAVGTKLRWLSMGLLLAMGCTVPAAPPATSAASRSTEATERGRVFFASYCSGCHGANAKGSSVPASPAHAVAPDLTTFGMRHGGFRADSVASYVDGRELVSGHGSREMPAWGRTLDDRLEVALEEEMKLTPAMISDIVDYLALVQEWE